MQKGYLLSNLQVGGGANADGLELGQFLFWGLQLQHRYVLVWVTAYDLYKQAMSCFRTLRMPGARMSPFPMNALLQ